MFNSPEFDDPGFSGVWVVAVDEIPSHLIDAAPVMDGDDTVYAERHGPDAFKLKRRVKPLKASAPVRVVPLHRDVVAGTSGPDVLAVKRALHRVGYLKVPRRWSRVLGPVAFAAVKKFQKVNGLAVDGDYGIRTHKRLVAAGAFDRYGAWLMSRAPVPDPEKELRNRIVGEAFWSYHNRDRIHYEQGRPIDGHRHPRKLPLWTDCSGMATDDYEWAGGPDPNGRGFDGLGYTGTMTGHGVKVAMPRPGDLNFYGWNGRLGAFEHVTVEVGGGWCVSHGAESGPLLLPRAYRADYHQSRRYV